MILLVFLSLLYSCAKDKETNDEITNKKQNKDWEPSMSKRVTDAWERGEGLLGEKGVFFKNKNNSGGNINFGETNIMWRASLKTLEKIPLLNTDYVGGIIISDWYSGESYNKNNYEEIKLIIKFASSEVKVSSFNVKSYKKICVQEVCTVKPGNESFNEKIKEKIIDSVRSILQEESKTKK